MTTSPTFARMSSLYDVELAALKIKIGRNFANKVTEVGVDINIQVAKNCNCNKKKIKTMLLFILW